MFRKITQLKSVGHSGKKYFTRGAMSFFTIGLILVIFVGIFSPVVKIQAQGIPGQSYTDMGTCTGNNGNFSERLMRGDCQQLIDQGIILGGVFTPDPPPPEPPAAPEPPKTDCGFSPSTWTDCFENVIQTIFVAILKMMSWITGIAGLLLNFVLKYTILDMKVNIDGLTGINTAWKILRDLMNIAFIFLLIYEGIKMIIGQSSTNDVRKFITGLVLASLLINFSLFFTKVMIDASNIVTIGFYQAILVPPPGSTVPIAEYGLSDPIARALGLAGLFGATGDPGFAGGNDMGGILIMALGSGMVLLVSAFVFFAVSILFIIRYIALIILMMLSPIAYMGIALPFVSGYAKDWWKAFNSQIIFGPVYMIMTWVILTLMSSPGFGMQGSFVKLFNDPTKPSFSNIGLLFNFALIIGLLIASLLIAKKVSSNGSNHIANATSRLSAFAGGVVIGGGARLMRNTVGRAGADSANNEDLKERATRERFGLIDKTKGAWAKSSLAAANKAATSSFDARATSSFEGVAKASGMGFGKVDVKKENFKAIKEAQGKAAEEKAKQYKPTDLAVEQAKAKLNEKTDEGQKFRDEEAERKRAHDIYIKSDDYKNSNEYENIQKLEDDNRRDKIKVRDDKVDIKYSQQKLDDLRIKMDEYAENTPEKTQIRDKIDILQKETARKQELLRGLENLVTSRGDTIDEYEFNIVNYMSEEKKALIATAGGTKNEKGPGGVDVIKDQAGNTVDRKVKSAYEQRTEATASRIENAGPMWRYAANTVGIAANVVGVPLVSIPKTKADRDELARRVRKASAPKNAAQLRKEAEKLEKKERVARGEKDEDEEETPEPTPAPTPTPAPENPPTT
ncbi:MAG: hypothetical protein WAX85_01820 [Minisyncoccia bacterium]